MLISLAKLWMFFGLRIVWQKLWMFFGMRKNLMEKIMRWKERKDVFATDFGGMFLAFENFSSVPQFWRDVFGIWDFFFRASILARSFCFLWWWRQHFLGLRCFLDGGNSRR